MATESFVESATEIERWRNALAIAIGICNFDMAFELFRPIASKWPALAALIVNDAIANWGLDESVVAPAPEVC